MSAVMTVTGPMPAADLGATLGHEHLWCDISVHSGRENNRVTDVARTVSELGYFRAAGGGSIIEVTPIGIGRSPQRLRQISADSGVPVVCGIAFYDQSVLPDWVWQADIEHIADFFIQALTVGEDGVQAGVIGELTSHNEPEPDMHGYQLDPIEQTIFQAAAKAQQATGAGITTHASLGRGGVAQLDILESAGADLTRVCIGHCDAHWHSNIDDDLAYYHAILQRGAMIEFDLIGWTELMSDEARADRIAVLVGEGFANRILLSTDTCRQSQLHANGGRGYDFLWTHFLPLLYHRGVSREQVADMLITAPKQLLAGKEPTP